MNNKDFLFKNKIFFQKITFVEKDRGKWEAR